MPMTEGYIPDQPLPSFLSANKIESQGNEFIWEAAGMSSHALKIGILAATVAVVGVVGIAAYEMRHSMTRLLKFSDSYIDISAWQRGTSQSQSTVQATAEVQAVQSSTEAELFAPAARDASARDQVAFPAPPVGQTQTENQDNTPNNEALFRQFRAWQAKQDAQAQQQDARTQVEQIQPELDAPAPIAVDDPLATPPNQKPRKPKLTTNGRPDTPPHVPLPRARLQWGQNTRVEGRPAQDARAADQAAQNAQTPSFFQSLLHQ